MDIFNSKKKKAAVLELEELQLRYNSIGREANDVILQLYSMKKQVVDYIDDVEEGLKKMKDAPYDKILEIADARASLRDFREAVEMEEKQIPKDFVSNSTGTVIAGSGAALGVGVATYGSTAAMAIATTFGTASTGTAISSLTGIAASNAALAWLGGGAAAAGGGGIAAGSAFLALAGPIGAAIGGIALAGGGLFRSWKNKKIANDAKKMADELRPKVKWLDSKLSIIKTDADSLKEQFIGLKDTFNNLINDAGDYLYETLDEVIRLIKGLCGLINKKYNF